MATDHTRSMGAERSDDEPVAYISPAADFLVLSVLATLVTLAGTAVVVP